MHGRLQDETYVMRWTTLSMMSLVGLATPGERIAS